MSGERYLLDTNAVIQLLKGNSGVSSLLENADFIALTLLAADDNFKKLKSPWKVRSYEPT